MEREKDKEKVLDIEKGKVYFFQFSVEIRIGFVILELDYCTILWVQISTYKWKGKL